MAWVGHGDPAGDKGSSEKGGAYLWRLYLLDRSRHPVGQDSSWILVFRLIYLADDCCHRTQPDRSCFDGYGSGKGVVLS